MEFFGLHDEDKQRIIDYFKQNWPRVAVSGVVLLIQFLWFFDYIRYANWKQQSILCKLFFILKLALVMSLLEIFRWTDEIIKNYLNSQSDKNNGSPVDTQYIEKNRGYK
jgi:hypothetical protein